VIDAEVLLRAFGLALIGVAGAILPISAAIREARKPRDADPLDIDSRYRKDDRYFAKSFENLLTKAIGPASRRAGTQAVHLHRDESVQTIFGDTVLRAGDVHAHIYDVDGNLDVERESTLSKEVVVRGSAHIGEDVKLRALKADGDVILESRVDVERWIDAGGRLRAGDGARLGARATSLDEIVLGADVLFQMLSASRIVVGEEGVPTVGLPEAKAELPNVADFAKSDGYRVRADGALLVEADFSLAQNMALAGDVIARGTIHLGPRSRIHGSLHSDLDVVMDVGAVVDGSVYAERDLVVGIEAVIAEHAVTAGSTIVHSRGRIGSPGRITTLLADGTVELWPGAVVWGRIVASRGGMTRSESDSHNLVKRLAE
jgi:cytoskeletal protein CcmA (bactofilin family)